VNDDNIELVPGSNVFISTQRLQQILGVVKTGKQLARKLMSVYWDRMVLARSTLSAASQHYEQLDPKIISAIKTYCVLFDSSVRKSEIHSTMIDKCVQARRPRRSSLKQLEVQLPQHSDYKQEVVHVSPPSYVLNCNVQHSGRKDNFAEDNHGMQESPYQIKDGKCTEIVQVSSSSSFIQSPCQSKKLIIMEDESASNNNSLVTRNQTDSDK
jgi:hypothetical protein